MDAAKPDVPGKRVKMNNVNHDAIALDAPQQTDRIGLEQAGALALFCMAGAVQFSIAK